MHVESFSFIHAIIEETYSKCLELLLKNLLVNFMDLQITIYSFQVSAADTKHTLYSLLTSSRR